jgi:hypothetical protein
MLGERCRSHARATPIGVVCRAEAASSKAWPSHSEHERATKAMTAMFQTARDKTITEPDVVAATLLSAMAGVSRAVLEIGVTRGTMATTMEKELTVMVRAYLDSSAENVRAVLRPPLPHRKLVL